MMNYDITMIIKPTLIW